MVLSNLPAMDGINSGFSSKLKRARPPALRDFPRGCRGFPVVANSRENEDDVAVNPSQHSSMETAPNKSPFSRVSERFSAKRDFPTGCGRPYYYSVSKDVFSNATEFDVPLENPVAETPLRKCCPPRNLKVPSDKHKFPSGKQDSGSAFEEYVLTNNYANQISDSDSKDNVPYNEKSAVDSQPVGATMGANVLLIRSSVNLGKEELDWCQESSGSRVKVKEVLEKYRDILAKLLRKNKVKPKVPKAKIYMEALMLLKSDHKWLNTRKQLGEIPGVQVGDRFQCRAELIVVGLHSHFYHGIDYMKKDRSNLATCIVATERYANYMESSDILIYSGHGGNPSVQKKQPLRDQKLERGNLALRNSMDSKTVVRVIRKLHIKGSKASTSEYVYDGLYMVEKFWQERGELGKLVFKFRLKRVQGQPKLTRGIASKQKTRTVQKEDILMNDISQGREKTLIRVVNSFDGERPPPFDYLANMIYPKSLNESIPIGCDCVDGCSDDEDCSCKIKNGGEMPYNNAGGIARKKPLIYECNPFCKCSSSCINQMSQRGLQVQLEVFKIESKGWGVRSRSYIRSGSFVCEYTGEIIQKEEAKHGGSCSDEHLYAALGNSNDSEGLSCYDKDGGFVIDASKYGNVGRFINHSCSPNLYVQNVLYDHDDSRMPHIMLFAMKDIPPCKELTLDYSYMLRGIGGMERKGMST